VQLRQKQEDILSLNVSVLAVASDKPEVLAPLVKALKLPFPLIGDPLQSAFRNYDLIERNNTLGGDFVIDDEGIVRYAHRGVTPDDRPPMAEIMDALTKATVKEE
jgi:peroxiredoxin